MREKITISLDTDLAEIYRSASESERRKLDLLINIRLRSILESKSRRPLQEIMDDISRKAQKRGRRFCNLYTPEILQSILDEE